MPKNNSGKTKAEMERLNLLFLKGRITEQYYDEQYERLDKKLKKETERQTVVSLEAYMNIKEHFSGDWIQLYQKLNAEHKRAFWKKFIKEIYIDPKTHKICGFDFLV